MSTKTSVCRKCGLETDLGNYYDFLIGLPISRSTEFSGTTQIRKTRYKMSSSEKIYFCNKCVCLNVDRVWSLRLRKAAKYILPIFGISALLTIVGGSIPYNSPIVGIFDLARSIALLTFLITIFIGPIALVQYNSLQKKEREPIQSYADIYNNPQHKTTQQGMKDLILNSGELLAIETQQPGLSRSGRTPFTHSEAREKLH